MTSVTVAVRGIGILGPGVDGWDDARRLLRGERDYDCVPMRNPAPAIMPAAERRRASLAIRLALEGAHQAVVHAAIDGKDVGAADCGAVFTSCDGDGDTINAVCLAIAEAGYPVSPTKFTNSVHNAPAGYWSIATGARLPSTSVCAWEGSFAAGLLEAIAQVSVEDRPMLLVASDAPLPVPLAPLRQVAHPFVCALVLTPARLAAQGAIGMIRVSLDSASPIANPVRGSSTIARTLASNAAAHSIALLEALARGGRQRVSLPYLTDLAALCDVEA